MTTPEGKVKDRIKKVLKLHGVYYHMPVQNGMGSPTLDFICCHRGYYIGIEAKAGKLMPTKRQEQTMKDITAAGGFVFVVNEESGLDELECSLALMG